MPIVGFESALCNVQDVLKRIFRDALVVRFDARHKFVKEHSLHDMLDLNMFGFQERAECVSIGISERDDGNGVPVPDMQYGVGVRVQDQVVMLCGVELASANRAALFLSALCVRVDVIAQALLVKLVFASLQCVRGIHGGQAYGALLYRNVPRTFEESPHLIVLHLSNDFFLFFLIFSFFKK